MAYGREIKGPDRTTKDDFSGSDIEALKGKKAESVADAHKREAERLKDRAALDSTSERARADDLARAKQLTELAANIDATVTKENAIKRGFKSVEDAAKAKGLDKEYKEAKKDVLELQDEEVTIKAAIEKHKGSSRLTRWFGSNEVRRLNNDLKKNKVQIDTLINDVIAPVESFFQSHRATDQEDLKVEGWFADDEE